jgi:hypothetical protein
MDVFSFVAGVVAGVVLGAAATLFILYCMGVAAE